MKIMDRLLYIIIDDTPIPKYIEDDILTIDCCQINDFCSLIEKKRGRLL